MSSGEPHGRASAAVAQAQEAFLEGHVLALAHFGAVPARVRYDNLEPAVTWVRVMTLKPNIQAVLIPRRMVRRVYLEIADGAGVSAGARKALGPTLHCCTVVN